MRLYSCAVAVMTSVLLASSATTPIPLLRSSREPSARGGGAVGGAAWLVSLSGVGAGAWAAGAGAGEAVNVGGGGMGLGAGALGAAFAWSWEP